ncbi:MAG: TldD/PmbA family protein [Candidatus Bathyarchaeota archaeon]|nr:TldD/PmbA family protein [Candidatus Bathyarchaeota archaeon]MDH5787505.1 TldD/PmbA family protein [Candidatus Bathyarchaeota archaeon]
MSSHVEELMDKAIWHGLKIGASFVEAKSEDAITRRIEAVNKEIRTVSEIHNIGIGVRVFYNKGNGFSFSNILDQENIANAVETAMKIAKASTKKTLLKLKLATVKPVTNKQVTNVSKHPRDVSLDEKKDLCLRQCKVAMGKSKLIANVTSMFAEYHGTIHYSNSEGTRVSYEPLLIGLGVSCVAKKGETIVDARDRHGGSVGLNTFEEEMHTPEKMAENAADWAIEKLKAKAAPAGKFESFIDPRLAGVLAHESFGHLSEADGVIIGMTPLAGKIGQKLGTEMVTIIDEGLPRKGGYNIYFDDEGVPCDRVEILKKGTLNSYLHSRETAHRLKMKPTGNARSQDYSFEPIVRMRNTYFDVGDWKSEEALDELEEGIYAIDTAGGQVEATGTFLFKAVRGYWVEKGEIKYPLRDVALTGNILEFLKNVVAVCNDLEISSTPFGGCGKMEQRALVGSGGPHIKVRDVLFGGVR